MGMMHTALVPTTRDNFATLRQPLGHAQRRVSIKCAQLEHVLAAADTHEHLEQLRASRSVGQVIFDVINVRL